MPCTLLIDTLYYVSLLLYALHTVDRYFVLCVFAMDKGVKTMLK